MHAALNQPRDEATQLGLVDLAFVIQRNEDRSEDALQFAQSGSNLSVGASR
jgi:hypothetical protein